MTPTTLVLGDTGAGKNLIIVKEIIDSKTPLNIHSNFTIKVDNYYPLTLVDLLDIEDKCIIPIDEAYSWIESRYSAKYINVFMSYVNFTLRHTKRQIFLTAQLLSSIDVRFRELWDYKIECTRVDNGSDDPDFFDFYYIKYDKKRNLLNQLFLSYDDASYYFDFFDTYEIVEFPSKSRIEYELLKTRPKLLYERSNLILSNIIDGFSSYDKYKGKYTKDVVKIVLMESDIDQIWADNIHLLINNKKKVKI